MTSGSIINCNYEFIDYKLQYDTHCAPGACKLNEAYILQGDKNFERRESQIEFRKTQLTPSTTDAAKGNYPWPHVVKR